MKLFLLLTITLGAVCGALPIVGCALTGGDDKPKTAAECTRCDDRGRIACRGCGGARAYPCRHCEGTGAEAGATCKHCAGQGGYSCPTCLGYGSTRCRRHGSE